MASDDIARAIAAFDFKAACRDVPCLTRDQWSAMIRGMGLTPTFAPKEHRSKIFACYPWWHDVPPEVRVNLPLITCIVAQKQDRFGFRVCSTNPICKVQMNWEAFIVPITWINFPANKVMFPSDRYKFLSSVEKGKRVNFYEYNSQSIDVDLQHFMLPIPGTYVEYPLIDCNVACLGPCKL